MWNLCVNALSTLADNLCVLLRSFLCTSAKKRTKETPLLSLLALKNRVVQRLNCSIVPPLRAVSDQFYAVFT